jgi:hypothetical protein
LLKIEKGEFINNLTVSRLITYNNNIKMSINMTK